MIARLREKQLHRWLSGYAGHALGRLRPQRIDGPRHLLFAFCDHWEPLWRNADDETGAARVAAWSQGYPTLARAFVDADGYHPRHSFFFPGEQYRPSYLDALARLAREGLGEVEVHLHHDGDTAATLQSQLVETLAHFNEHGHLSRGPDGRLRYAFIHGNWALANSRRDGRWCGVPEELVVLFRTGCYADFTFPSAPDETQPNVVNQIYWPAGDLNRARGHERAVPARVGHVMTDRLLMIEGPLALALRPSRLSLRIEASALTAKDPATRERVATWTRQAIHVAGRPEWVFVKVHTHGAPEGEAASLLGDGGRALHEILTGRYNDGQSWVLHYVTAREMYNIAIAAMEGRAGNPAAYRDHVLPPPPVAARPTNG